MILLLGVTNAIYEFMKFILSNKNNVQASQSWHGVAWQASKHGAEPAAVRTVLSCTGEEELIRLTHFLAVLPLTSLL